MNAFTTQEYTAFYVRVPDDHLAVAADILSAVVWAPGVPARRGRLRAPGDPRRDPACATTRRTTSCTSCSPPRCTRSTRSAARCSARRDTITCRRATRSRQYHREHYRPSNVVVAAAGNLEHEQMVELISAGLGVEDGRARHALDPSFAPPETLLSERRPTEQAHLVLGVRALARDDPDRYALSVVNQALGGGMSSRLFQEVREKRGLAYSVYSYRVAFDGTGALGVYAGTSPERAHETLRGDPRRARPPRRRRSARARARRGEGPPQGLDRAVARDQLEPDAPARAQRAHDRTRCRRSTSSSPRSTRSRSTTRPGSSSGSSPSEPRVLAVVGPFDADDFV